MFTPCTPAHGDRCTPGHAAMMDAWRESRAVYEAQREAATIGYATESVEYNRDHPHLSFHAFVKQWHDAHRDPGVVSLSSRAEERATKKRWNRDLADAARAMGAAAYREVIADWEFAQVLRDSGESVADALETLTRQPVAV